MTKILNGTAIADFIKREIKEDISRLARAPGLAVILAGDDPASRIYVNHKRKACAEVGIDLFEVHLPANVSAADLEKEIVSLNQNPRINGVILQLPLPPHLNSARFTPLINPQKDVDGLHPLNQGLLFSARRKNELGSVFLPCTAQAVLRLIEETGINLEGRKAVIVGRSNLVGKPIACLLLLENMTVTICHFKTTDLAKETSFADVLVVAAGTPKLISKEHVKKGAVVIDVGINRLGDKLVGDVDFEAVKEKV
ncbi:bifunctional 5,10-methylenetetrahydrofolate dehydrogenase/5,10-methenyltetrahydrofolate cyclohydrolase, partial [Patescibacteria group bacterium]|nr:bifunctional 5,10-methylenetetrahydrofolate dehydrogenase/5,10-methenyltetrahydrofolate cyclohydrolase [Patescibacteria group bacterium]